MNSPLAPLFAQVREAFMVASFDGLTGEQQATAEAGYAALSAIERHVQDMTRWEKIAKDWRYSNEFLGGVVRQTWPAEYPRAALPAREKEEE